MSVWYENRSPNYRFDWEVEADELADELEREGPHAWCCDDLAEAILSNASAYESERQMRAFKDEVNDILEERRGYSPEDEEDEAAA